jgi:arylesterase / paraoxonase
MMLTNRSILANNLQGDFPDVDEPDSNAELYAYHYIDPSLPDPKSLVRIQIIGFESELRTLGIEFHEPTSTLLVTNHRREGSRIEQFHLDLDSFKAVHVRSITHPLIYSPNSIAVLSESEFFVTNQHHFFARDSPRLLWAFETYVAPPIASIVHVRILEGGSVDGAVVMRQAYPNGITLLNQTTLAVAATNKRLIYLYSMSSNSTSTEHPTLELQDSIWLPFLPDNLAVSKSDGALLIAGHPHLPSLNKFTRSRRICHRPEVLERQDQETREACAQLTAASWACEWTPEGGIKHVYAGWDYPSSASVVRDRENGVGILAGLYAKGIFVWRD